MFKSMLRFFIVAVSLLMIQPVASAANISVQEVYQAARSGHMKEALSMMDQVLSEHPNSAQAHFVEAELLARGGEMDKARDEFSKARELNPGLTFEKPAAVQALQQQLYPSNLLQSDSVTRSRGISLAPFIVIGLLVLSVVLFIRSRQRAAMQNAMYNNVPPPGYGSGYGPGYGPGYPPSGGGLGSSILGGLATGAAVGAGMVAGEALASRLMDGGENHHSSNDVHPDVNQDMGGNDFGLNDSSSWDAGGGGDFGGDIGGGDWS
ncbi:MAG: tetratricopeptide repeat protein [Steroidobacter sp.]